MSLSPSQKAILLAAAAPFLASCAFLIGLDEPSAGKDGTSDATDGVDGDPPDLPEDGDADARDDGAEPSEEDPSDEPPDTEDGVDQVDGDAGATTVIFGDTPDADYPGTVLDTFINLDHINDCTGPYLATYTWPDASIANAVIISWDLSALPEDATVTDAVLQLYLCDLDGTGGIALYTLTAHRIINHEPVICSCDGYTYDGVNPWTPYEGLLDNIPLAQADITPAESTLECDTTFGYKSWNVTQMVRDWVTGAAPNYGMLVNSDPDAPQDANRYFCSSDNEETAMRPKLIVTHATP
jgi:hypothetical protein